MISLSGIAFFTSHSCLLSSAFPSIYPPFTLHGGVEMQCVGGVSKNDMIYLVFSRSYVSFAHGYHHTDSQMSAPILFACIIPASFLPASFLPAFLLLTSLLLDSFLHDLLLSALFIHSSFLPTSHNIHFTPYSPILCCNYISASLFCSSSPLHCVCQILCFPICSCRLFLEVDVVGPLMCKNSSQRKEICRCGN